MDFSRNINIYSCNSTCLTNEDKYMMLWNSLDSSKHVIKKQGKGQEIWGSPTVGNLWEWEWIL